MLYNFCRLFKKFPKIGSSSLKYRLFYWEFIRITILAFFCNKTLWNQKLCVLASPTRIVGSTAAAAYFYN